MPTSSPPPAAAAAAAVFAATNIDENDIVQRAVLLRARPASQWPFLWPFFAVEAILVYMAVDPSVIYDTRYYEDNRRAIDFLHVVAVPIVIFVQCFFGLLTVWNTSLKARTRFVDTLGDVASASHVFVVTKAHRGEPAILPLAVDPVSAETMFTFQQVTWRYSHGRRAFLRPVYPTSGVFTEYQNRAKVAAQMSVADAKTFVNDAVHYFGKNVVDIRVPEFHELLVDHMLAPFFVFQMFCVTLWLLDDYWMVALFNGFMMFSLECTVVTQRQRSTKSMREMGALPVTNVRVFREGKWTTTPSTELVPMDVIELDSDVPAPADVVLVAGSCAANEAMLTGESTPQMKTALPVDDHASKTRFNIDEHARHTVFSGTQILASTPGEGVPTDSAAASVLKNATGAIGIVIQTGFQTKQGNLVRTIIHSQSRVSENSGEAFSFIALLLVFACAASYYVLQRGLADPTKSRWKLFLTCTQIITNVVPPELPMQLALAVNTSLMSLMKLRVFCTEPFRIPFAGKLDTCCFDKTGTLTTDEMLFAGVDQVQAREPTLRRGNFGADSELVLASCHSLVTLNDSKTAGDAMEKAAVDALGWRCVNTNLVEKQQAPPAATGSSKPSNTRDAISILKRYPFDSSLKRMSAVVSSTRTGRFVVAKGAPEAVAKLCLSVPGHYQEVADHYAMKGLRVIALASRRVSLPDGADSSAAVVEALVNLHRDEAERGLNFVGFAVFECPLKTDSAETIRMLTAGSHRCVMITGDSIPTAAAVAAVVGMASDTNAYVAAPASSHDSSAVTWKPYRVAAGQAPVASPPQGASVFVNAEVLSDDAFDEVVRKFASRVAVWARCAPHQKELIVATLKAEGACVLMAGDGTNDVGGLKQAHVGIAVLNSALMTQSIAATTAPPVGGTTLGAQRPTTITATPGEFVNPMPPPLREGASFMEQMKHQFAVAKHQAEIIHKKKLEDAQRNAKQQQAANQAVTIAKAKEATGVDSATAAAAMSSMFNDLDDTSAPPMIKLGDASIAAPFTCKSKKMTAICDIVRLGRCTLVTTLQMYKILALNCLVSAYTIAVLFTDGVKFSQTQTVTSGLMIAVCFLFLSRSKPLETLSAERPINRVFHPYTMVSIFGQFAVHLYSLAMSLQLVTHQEPDALAAQRGEEEEDFRPTLLNSVLFLMTTMMSVTTFAVNYKGHPFMTSLRQNKPMAVCLGLLTAMVVVCSFEYDPEFNATMELVPFPSDKMREEFLVLLAIDVFGTFAVEKVSQLVLGKLP